MVPVACDLDASCYVQSYVDAEPGPESRDYACGTLSYDTHRGTDFRVRDPDVLAAGVDVRASATGIVAAVRDGEPDINIRRVADSDTRREIKTRKALGNAVVVRHPDGYETYYGHLRQGSVRVRSGQPVAAGDVLGTVGLSGDTEFPHLHFEVRRDGSVVDPFSGDVPSGCGGDVRRSLWRAEALATMAYVPTRLHDTGFATAVPDDVDVLDGLTSLIALDRDASAIVFWAVVVGAAAGDELTVRLTGPDGDAIAESSAVVPHPQAQTWRATGRRVPPGGWPAGTYTGTAILVRGGLTAIEGRGMLQVR
jgi:hypothetical protein